MSTIKVTVSSIQMRGTDAQGAYATAEVDGEWQGVSLRGSDEVVRDLSELRPGTRIEVGAAPAVVVADTVAQ